MSSNSVRTSVLLSHEQYAKLSELSARADVSVAWLIRKAVQQFLDSVPVDQMPLPIAFTRQQQ
jgi:predicted DNA-binding protein